MFCTPTAWKSTPARPRKKKNYEKKISFKKIFYTKCNKYFTSIGYNAPKDLYKEFKEQGFPLPIRSGDKYLAYEQSKTHPDRKTELLPSNNFRHKVEPPFALSIARARTVVDCSECDKPRVVYSESKPSLQEVKDFRETVDNLIWNCGTTLNNETFAVNENLACADFIESSMYTKLIDQYGGDVICYNCGDVLDTSCTKEYLDKKINYSTVKPTCGKKYCLKNKKIKWKTQVPRKSTSKFKHEQTMKRKLETLKLLDQQGNRRRKRQRTYSEYNE